jgi:hypothetical protein
MRAAETKLVVWTPGLIIGIYIRKWPVWDCKAPLYLSGGQLHWLDPVMRFTSQLPCDQATEADARQIPRPLIHAFRPRRSKVPVMKRSDCSMRTVEAQRELPFAHQRSQRKGSHFSAKRLSSSMPPHVEHQTGPPRPLVSHFSLEIRISVSTCGNADDQQLSQRRRRVGHDWLACRESAVDVKRFLAYDMSI